MEEVDLQLCDGRAPRALPFVIDIVGSLNDRLLFAVPKSEFASAATRVACLRMEQG
jgi:hypothetical protein